MIYWILFFGIFVANIKFKKDSSFYLWLGFYIFTAGSIISLLGVFNLSEIIFRICLIFLLVGFIYSARDYFTR